jgi:hypothetical protein
MADRDDLARTLTGRIGDEVHWVEIPKHVARMVADRILAAGWVKATDDLRERLRFELYAAGHPEGTAEGPMVVYLDDAVEAALRALHPNPQETNNV